MERESENEKGYNYEIKREVKYLYQIKIWIIKVWENNLTIDGQIDRQIDIQIDIQIGRYLGRQIDRYLGRYIGRQMGCV